MTDPQTPQTSKPAESTQERPSSDRPPTSGGAVAIRAGGDGAAVDPAQEKDQWSGRTSWKYFAGSLVLWFVLSIATLFVISGVAGESKARGFLWQVQWDLGIITVMGLICLGRIAAFVYNHKYRLSNQRLWVQRGIFSQTIDQIELIRVDDLRMHKSLTDRLLGLGTIEVMSTDATDKQLRIIGIADPETVAESIRNNMRQLRKKSLFVENL